MVQGGQLFAAVAVHFQVIVLHLVGWPEAEHRTGADQLFINQLVQHGLGIAEQRGGRFADHFVLENARVFAGQVPGDEERRPVDVLGQRAQVDIFQQLAAGEARPDRRVAGPVELRLVSDGLGIAQALGARTAVGGALADHGVLFAGLVDERRLEFLGQQSSGDAHRARSVGDVDHCIVVVLRVDLHRGVRLGRGGAADHQRQAEALALHFLGDVDHLVQRRRDQAGEADDVALLGDGGLQNLLRRHHHAHVDHVVTVTAEHHADDVLADVVHVAFHCGHEDLALGFRLVAFFRFDEGNQMGDGLLHHTGGFDHLWQEHLAGAEQVANHVHTAHQRAFDHLDGSLALLAAFLGVFDDKGGDALDQCMLEALVHR